MNKAWAKCLLLQTDPSVKSGRFGKLNKKVTFPDKLDLTPYMSATDGTDQYNLYAVVVHLDMLNASFFGHYICYIKDRRGHWRKIDDCKVMFVVKEEVHAQGAYMLLYSRRTARPGPLLAVKEPIKQEKQCEVPPSNGENHSIPEDMPVKCVSFVNSSEDLRADSLLFLEQVLRLLKMFASNGKSIDGLQFSSLFLPRHFIIAMLKMFRVKDPKVNFDFYSLVVGMSLRWEALGWFLFYAGNVGAAFGSAYYHLKPDDDRLIWDRLPMMMSASSLLSILVIERVDERAGLSCLISLLPLLIVSTACDRVLDDMRLWVVLNLVPCVVIPAMLFLFPPKYTHSRFWFLATAFYLLARFEGLADKKVYSVNRYFISGHSLEHLCFAMVTLILTVMLSFRNIKITRYQFNQCSSDLDSLKSSIP